VTCTSLPKFRVTMSGDPIELQERKGTEMEHDLINTGWHLGIRLSGPLKFRFILQPGMAIFLAVRCALKDARDGKPPYFWGMLTATAAERLAMLKDGWKSLGTLLIAATLMDAIYQFIVQRWIYPSEAIVVAVILAVVPYLLVRGPINRIVRPSSNITTPVALADRATLENKQ